MKQLNTPSKQNPINETFQLRTKMLQYYNFSQYDTLGSTVAITDKNGVVKNKYAYDDFGNLATNSSETIPNPFKYIGRYGVMADLSDLLYMRARYYVPSIGRFISKDPIGLRGGLNFYIYAGNTAVNFIDPKGSDAKETVGFIACVANFINENWVQISTMCGSCIYTRGCGWKFCVACVGLLGAAVASCL